MTSSSDRGSSVQASPSIYCKRLNVTTKISYLFSFFPMSVMFLFVSPQYSGLRHLASSEGLRTYENRPHIRSLNKLTSKRLRCIFSPLTFLYFIFLLSSIV